MKKTMKKRTMAITAMAMAAAISGATVFAAGFGGGQGMAPGQAMNQGQGTMPGQMQGGASFAAEPTEIVNSTLVNTAAALSADAVSCTAGSLTWALPSVFVFAAAAHAIFIAINGTRASTLSFFIPVCFIFRSSRLFHQPDCILTEKSEHYLNNGWKVTELIIRSVFLCFFCFFSD